MSRLFPKGILSHAMPGVGELFRSAVAIITDSFLLLETSDYLLLEDGSKIKLE